ncbi:necrosis and ethylene-inducing protein 2 precursor [Mycena filopes]|nr:necrosis and ethylene-inducing protein 2 precursor [Mycena filopes]
MVLLSLWSKFGLLTLALVGAIPLQKRASIPSDAVVGFPQTVPSGTVGSVYLAYKPHLFVVNGCVPFPAVDAEGNTNAGLNPTGATNGGCSSSTGQVYVRSGTSGGRFALLYSWYMPKDEPFTGLGPQTRLGRRDRVAQLCDEYHRREHPRPGTSPLIQYESIFPLDHAMGLTSTVGGTQPLIAWESLPAAAQAALETTDFGAAIVPFKDDTLVSNLAACDVLR